MPTFDRLRLLAEARLFGLLTEPMAGAAVRDDLLEIFGNLFLSGASPGRRMEVVSDLHTVSELLRRKDWGDFRPGDRVGEIARELGASFG